MVEGIVKFTRSRRTSRTPPRACSCARTGTSRIWSGDIGPEEIQELFQKSVSSLRYCQERKCFIATVEQKHPIYRLLFAQVGKCNFTMRRKLHTLVWIASLVEELRCGKIKVPGAKDSGKMLRLRNTLMNGIFVRGFTRKTRHRRPLAPSHGTSFPEVTGRQTYLLEYDTPGKQILKWHPVWRGCWPGFP